MKLPTKPETRQERASRILAGFDQEIRRREALARMAATLARGGFNDGPFC